MDITDVDLWVAPKFCKEAHQLTWIQDYSKMQCKLCQGCGQTNYVGRYYCNVCKTVYCFKCTLPPLDGQCCGGGHQLKKIQAFARQCDLCRKSIQGLTNQCKICEYDLCQNCIQERED